MASGHALPAEIREQILEAYRNDERCRDIAARFGVSRSVVSMSAHRAGLSRTTRAEVSPKALTYGRWVWTGGIARWQPYTGPYAARRSA